MNKSPLCNNLCDNRKSAKNRHPLLDGPGEPGLQKRVPKQIPLKRSVHRKPTLPQTKQPVNQQNNPLINPAIKHLTI